MSGADIPHKEGFWQGVECTNHFRCADVYAEPTAASVLGRATGALVGAVRDYATGQGPIAMPGTGDGFTKLRGDQGFRDESGNIWKKDRLHKDHWDVTDRSGKKIREVTFDGRELWPNGPKNNNR